MFYLQMNVVCGKENICYTVLYLLLFMKGESHRLANLEPGERRREPKFWSGLCMAQISNEHSKASRDFVFKSTFFQASKAGRLKLLVVVLWSGKLGTKLFLCHVLRSRFSWLP